MWFRTLSLIIATALLGKAAIALSIPVRFYAERQRQYASLSPPTKVLVPPVVIVGLALVAWYATIFHYKPWGWIVTASLTALACVSVYQLSRWATHRHKMQKVVANPKVWRVDWLLLAIGALFVVLAVYVY
jgi:hypothetical protein